MIKTHIEVEGVILTPGAINQLGILQDHNNEMLNVTRENIADAVCALARRLDDFQGEDLQKVKYLLADLAIIRDNLNKLRKP